MIEPIDPRVVVVSSAAAGNAAAIAATELQDQGFRVESASDRDGRTHDVFVVVESGAACGDRAIEHVTTLRSRGCRAPVLVLCEEPSHVFACRCLEAGADDYLRVPCETAELAARIRRFRFPRDTRARSDSEPPESGTRSWIVPPESLMVNEHEQSVRIGEYRAILQDLPFQLFTYLRSSADVWRRRSELIERVLCRKAASPAAVRWHVHCLRDALGPYHALVHGDGKLGYMFSFHECKKRHCRSGLRARSRLVERKG